MLVSVADFRHFVSRLAAATDEIATWQLVSPTQRYEEDTLRRCPPQARVLELAVLEGDILRERIQSHDTREPLENCLAAMEKRLAAIRGAQ